MEQNRLSTPFQASRQQQNQNAVWVRALGSWSTISFWSNAGTGNLPGPQSWALGRGTGLQVPPACPAKSSAGAAGFTLYGLLLEQSSPPDSCAQQCSQEGTRGTGRMQDARPDSQLQVLLHQQVHNVPVHPQRSSPTSATHCCSRTLSTLSHHYPGHFRNHPKQLKLFLEAFQKTIKPPELSSATSVLCPPPQVNICHKILSLHWNVSAWP